MRYYQRRREYVAKGPPHPVMRFLVAPVLVVSTIGDARHRCRDDRASAAARDVVGLHKASFVVWVGAIGIHVLVYGRRLLRLLGSERRPAAALLRVPA